MDKKRTIFVNGGKVRDYRKHLGMSQSALADGICTQATISLIEKQNKVPNMNTLISVAKRLNIGVEELIVRSLGYGEKQIISAEAQLQHYKFGRVLSLLGNIEEKQLDEITLVQRYHYLLGTCALFYSRDLVTAAVHYSRVLATARRQISGVPIVVAKLGLALTYAEMGKIDKTSLLVEEASEAIKQLQPEINSYAGMDVTVLWYLACCYNRLGERDDALETIKKAQQRALANGQLYLLDEIYSVYSECIRKMGGSRSNRMANAAQDTALTLAKILGNRSLVNRVTSKSDESVIAN